MKRVSSMAKMEKPGQARFPGTALRVLCRNRACPGFPRLANWALAVLLMASLVPAAVRPWHERSGLSAACRYVAEHTEPGDLVMSNYWRHIIERFTGRTMPRDWLDGVAERLIAEGKVRYVILDESQYTRTVIHTTGRARVADWVRRTFPEERAFRAAPSGAATRVYRTDAAPPRIH